VKYPVLNNKQIVLGVCGGIAAYKSAELLRLLKKQGANVRVIMTRNACRFVGTITFEALSENPVYTDVFQSGDDGAIRHIAWATEADAVIIAPATANIIGKYANGIADDALSTFLLAVTSPVLVCPSMNVNMYQHHTVRKNIETLTANGCMISEPSAGSLACGTSGPGRLPEPPEILDRIAYALTPKDFIGKRVLVTAGPTREFFDPVRYISNPSSGKMGFAIARAAEHRGASVTLVSGPVNLPDPPNINIIRVTTAEDMAQAVFHKMENSDIIIKSAAVSDYRPKDIAAHKVKKGDEENILILSKNQDILKALGQKKTHQILVGFAAETQELEANASKKMAEKNLDMIVGNLVNVSGSGFGTDTNQVTLFYRNGTKECPPVMEKESVANMILDRILKIGSEKHGTA
jgi:phosphopantothenoylcysteine decarboxylase/phosphopantothenate--cysteine ligase